MEPLDVISASGTRWNPDLNDEAFWESLGRLGEVAFAIHRHDVQSVGGGVRTVGDVPDARPTRTRSLIGIPHHPVATMPSYDVAYALSAFTPGMS